MFPWLLLQEAEVGRRMATFEMDKHHAIAWETIDAELDRRSL